MKFGHSLAVSLAALVCSASVALAQAPDKGGAGGMGGGAVQAPAEKMETGPRGGSAAGGGQESRQPARGMGQSGERGGPEKGASERGPRGERASGKSAQSGGDRDQGKAARTGADRDRDAATRSDRDRDAATRGGRDQDQDKAARSGRERDQDKAARSGRDKEQDKTSKSPREPDQGKAARTDRDKDQGKAARGGTPDKGAKASRAQASAKQHAEVRTHLLRDRKVERARIDVSVSIGARVPRSVRLHPLSPTIVGFAPVYRGYSYVLLEDETICIVDPETYVIVDVIPASTQRAERAAPRGQLTLSSEDRRFVLQHIDRGRSADIAVRLALGAEVPRSVAVDTFPGPVLERIPQLRSYRYVVAQDQVVVVDPDDHQVELLIAD